MLRRRHHRFNWILPAVFLFIVGGFTCLGYQAITAPARGEDGCRESGAPELQVVAIDGSDRIEPDELSQLAAFVKRLALRASPDTRISMFTAGGGEELDLVPVFSGCSLARQSGILTGDVFARRETEAFLEKPSAWLPDLAKANRSQSPLIEINERLLYRADVVDAQARHLVFVSDLLQNSPLWSVYRGTPSYRTPSVEALPEPGATPPAQWDTVTILVLQRPGSRHLQTQTLELAWIAYFNRHSKSPPILRKF